MGAEVLEGLDRGEAGAGGAEFLEEGMGAAEVSEGLLRAGIVYPGDDVEGGEVGVVEGLAEVGGGEAVGQAGFEEGGLFGGGEGG